MPSCYYTMPISAHLPKHLPKRKQNRSNRDWVPE